MAEESITIKNDELFALTKELRELSQKIKTNEPKAMLIKYRINIIENTIASILEKQGLTGIFKVVDRVKKAMEYDDWEEKIIQAIKEEEQ